MEKIFKQKNFNSFVCAPLGSRVNIYINFCLQVHFKVSAAWYCSLYLPPVSLILGAICHRRHWHRRQFAAGIVDTGGKFATSVKSTRETRGKIFHRCRWHRGQIKGTISAADTLKWTWRRKFIYMLTTPVSTTPAAICHQYRWHRWCTLTCEYLWNFRKNLNWPYCYFQGLGGRWFMKKTWSKKSRDTVPLIIWFLVFEVLLTYLKSDVRYL